MSETCGRRSETEPLEYHGEPLRRLGPAEAAIEGFRRVMDQAAEDIRAAQPAVAEAVRKALGLEEGHG